MQQPQINRNFDKGLITLIEGETIPPGAASESLNWHFFGDRVELRRGQAVLGDENAGVGKVTFVRVGRKYNEDSTIFWGYGRKILYYIAETLENAFAQIAGTSAELITNGAFSGNDNGWTVGAGWTYGTNKESFSQATMTGTVLVISSVAGGAGYAVGDILTFPTDGDGNLTVYVRQVNDAGAITDPVVLAIGTNYPSSFPGIPTGGTGSGASFGFLFVFGRALSQPMDTVAGVFYNVRFDATFGVAEDAIIVLRAGLTEDTAHDVASVSSAGTTNATFMALEDGENLYIYGGGYTAPDAPPWTGDITNLSITSADFVLPAAADGEDMSSTLYQSLGGSFVHLSSPNSSQYKIPTANPDSVVDLLEDTFRGYIKAGKDRMFLWNRKDKYGGSDPTGLYVSTIDKDSLADYDFTSQESVGTGDGSTTEFTGTLAFKAINEKKTCHFVRIAGAIAPLTVITAITQATSPLVTATGHGLAVGDVVVIQDVVGMIQINKRIAVVVTVPTVNSFTIDIDTTGFTAYSSGGNVGKAELFTDDRSGGLSGNKGGTGIINYASGVFDVTFSAAVTNLATLVSDYYSEDSTNEGPIDFENGDGSSIADAQDFRQDDAGIFRNIGSISGVEYCMHSIKSYAVRLQSTDTISNLIHREKVGVPYWRASVATGEGIYYLDASDPKKPTVRLYQLANYSAEVVPRPMSDQLDLSTYLFDQAKMFEWGEYIGLACRTFDSTINNRVFLYNRTWKTWEVHDFRISDCDVYNGALVGGDSGSNNIVKLFTGLADGDTAIPNVIIFGKDNLQHVGVKDIRRYRIAGYIGDDQSFDVSYSVDNEPFVQVVTISGAGAYVDLSQRKIIGNLTLGEIIGGGQSQEDSIFASPYAYEFNVGTPRFERIRIKIEATEVGYLSISEMGAVDWRTKGSRMPIKYVQTT